MTDQDEPTKEELLNKIEDLEEQQEQQQSTIERMMPNRRQALKGLGLLGAGGILGSSSASAQTGSAGQIGTKNDQPLIYADQIGDSNNRVSTLYGETVNAPTIVDSNDGTSYDVGDDLATSPGLKQSDISNVTVYSGDRQSVSGDSFGTIFDLTSGIKVLGGHVYGYLVTDIRITWDDDTTQTVTVGSNYGKTANGDLYSITHIPKLIDNGAGNVKTLEFYNDRGGSKEYGYVVYTL